MLYTCSKIRNKCNPGTMVGRIRLLGQVVRPSVVKDAQDVEPAAWRDTYLRLVGVFGERLSDAG